MPGIITRMEPTWSSADKIHEDAMFFDKLVELVPAKFYFGTEEEEPNWKYMHNRHKTPAAKQAAKDGMKKAKRAKLDPSNFKSNLEIQKERAQQKSDNHEDAPVSDPPGSETGPAAPIAFQNGVLSRALTGAEGNAASHSELKERLQKRIEELKAKREMEEERKERKKRKRVEGGEKKGGGVTGGTEKAAKGGAEKTGKGVGAKGSVEKGAEGVAEKAAERSEAVVAVSRKGKSKDKKDVKDAKSEGGEARVEKEGGGKKQREKKGGKKQQAEEGITGVVKGAEVAADAERPSKKAKPSKDVAAPSVQLPAPPPLQFNKLEIDGGASDRRKQKKKSKKEQKKVLLKKATQLQTELKEKAGTKEGQEKLAKHTWSASLKRASGEKVLDDPKLLKKSLKSEEKRKEHSAKKWKGRKAQDREAVIARQEKRSTNLKQRSDAKKERKIQKREKKLLSPGRKKSA